MDFRNLFALVYVLPALFSMYFGNALIGLLLVMGEGEYRTNNPQDNARLQIGQDFGHDPILNLGILFSSSCIHSSSIDDSPCLIALYLV